MEGEIFTPKTKETTKYVIACWIWEVLLHITFTFKRVVKIHLTLENNTAYGKCILPCMSAWQKMPQKYEFSQKHQEKSIGANVIFSVSLKTVCRFYKYTGEKFMHRGYLSAKTGKKGTPKRWCNTVPDFCESLGLP